MSRPRNGARGSGQRKQRRIEPPIEAELEIESIAAGGEGVGRLPDGRVVFVHRTAPGDLARVRVTEDKRNYARARLIGLSRPSEQRRTAPCPHYDRCGGCTLEHLEYEAQLSAKSKMVADALTRIGKIPLDPPDVVASPDEFRYRNRVSFTLKRGGRGQVWAGFHELGRPGRILEITGDCQLPEEPISRVWDRLRAAWGPDARLLPSGEELRLTLRATASGEVSLLVEGGGGPGHPDELVANVDGLSSIWHRRAGRDRELLAGTEELVESWGGEELRLGGAAFLQVNRGAAHLLETHVLDLAATLNPETVVDAYCGIGVYARRLAESGARTVGIELDAHAAAEARRLAPTGCSIIEGAVEAELPATLPADLVVLNPPRPGLAPEVIDTLLEEPPTSMIYVSCNPATLARDLKRLGERFELEHIRCFDLFPQTAHVETVAVISRTDS